MDTKNTTTELESLRLPELQARFLEVVGETSRSPNRKFLIQRIEETLVARAQTPPAQPEEQTTVPSPEAALAWPPKPPKRARERKATLTPSSSPRPAATAPTSPEEPPALAPQPETTPTHDEPSSLPTSDAPSAPSKPARGRFSALSVQQLQAIYLEVVGRPTGSDNKAYLIWKIREAEKGRITVGPVQPRRSEGAAASVDVKILPLRLETKVVEAMDAAWRDRGIKNRMEFFRRALSHYLIRLGATEAAALFSQPDSLSTESFS